MIMKEKPKQIDLPITRIALFSSGVGYYEHEGVVTDNATMRLAFRVDQLNDVLKSMILSDFDGGQIRSVSYPTQDPVDHALQSFEIDLSRDMTLKDLLMQVRGSHVIIHGKEVLNGSVLGVEIRETIYKNPESVVQDRILNLCTNEGIQSINLNSIQRFEFQDQRLTDELNQALGVIASSRNRQKRSVDILFSGQGERRVRIGYLIESSIWKMSYRLDLSNEQNILQGWALVDNTTDYDWKDVRLSLISGQPISFISDLYNPLYAKRPTVSLKLQPSVAPQIYDEGIEEDTSRNSIETLLHEEPGNTSERPAYLKRSHLHRARKGPEIEILKDIHQTSPTPMSIDDGVKSCTEIQPLGELFCYNIDHPVSINRRNSCMLSIISTRVNAERVSIFNEKVLSSRALNGAILHNDTSMKLLGGPITIFDENMYAGDAQIEYMAPDDKRHISYAIDLEASIDASRKNKSHSIIVAAVKGYLHIKTDCRMTTLYRIKNKAKKQKTIIIEHPFHSDQELRKPAHADEKTKDYYRFQVTLEENEVKNFEVEEQKDHSEEISMLTVLITDLQYYLVGNETPEKIQKALTKLIKMRSDIANLKQKEKQYKESIEDIRKDQERIRSTLNYSKINYKLKRRLLKKLNNQEDMIEEHQVALEKNKLEKTEKQKELDDYIQSIDFPLVSSET